MTKEGDPEGSEHPPEFIGEPDLGVPTPEVPLGDVGATAVAIAIPETQEDIYTRQRAARFIGACAVSNEATLGLPEQLTVSPIESLYDAIHQAAEGSQEAYKMVETNVKTDMIERTMKTGHVIKVDLNVDAAGRIQQYGQTMESVQANSLRLAANSWQMRERTEAEATNMFRIEDNFTQGKLEDHSLVVFSMAADNMEKADMDKVGFFIDTMSCAIQVTSAEGNQLTTESAFVSGVKSVGEERHDAKTVVEVGARLGVDLRGKSATEILNTPILVPNTLIKDGAIDIVKMWDEAAGDTFFGEDRPQEDYGEYLEKCQAKEEQFQPLVAKVAKKLIERAPKITDRMSAVETLNAFSQAAMVDQAMGDEDINPDVFGKTAGARIRAGRKNLADGDTEAFMRNRNIAQETAVSFSCPSAGNEANQLNSEYDEDCEFVSKECPVCKAKNVLTKVTKTRISGSCGCSKSK